MRRGIPFRPPAVDPTLELGWALARALGPVDAEVEAPRPGRAVELAERLDVASRIGARVPRQVLVAELGEEAADLIRRRYHQAAAALLVLELGCGELVAAATALDIPVILLKGMAMWMSGRMAKGLRPVSDIDALVPAGSSHRLQAELVRRGWIAAEIPAAEHQLPPVSSPMGAVAEVHLMVRGVRMGEGRASAGAEDLIRAGLVEALPQLEGDCSAPVEELLMAHALVHGLAHHGFSPHSYPPLRLLADLQTLGWDAERWREFEAGGYRWIERDVSPEAVSAARELSDRIGAGEAPLELLVEESDAGLLLRHMVAGGLDEHYRRSLRFSALSRPLGAGSRAVTVGLTLVRSIWLSRAQVEILYGRPRTALGYWGWRLWRPVDVIIRAVRYGASWARLRLKRR